MGRSKKLQKYRVLSKKYRVTGTRAQILKSTDGTGTKKKYPGTIVLGTVHFWLWHKGLFTLNAILIGLGVRNFTQFLIKQLAEIFT